MSSRRSFKFCLREVAFAGLRYSGIPWILREFVHKREVAIVTFHAPDIRHAETHLKALRNRYNIIALKDYLRYRLSNSPSQLPPKSLIITLDDGHKSNFDLMPLLEEMQLPVTIFLCSGAVGTHRHFWWFNLDSGQAQALKKVADEERLRLLLQNEYTPEREYAERHALSNEEIETLKTRVDFQAHTVNHPILPRCTDCTAEQEIRSCKEALEEKYGLNIYALAYPNGDYSARDLDLVRKAGYACALTQNPGFNDAHTNVFCLNRIAVQDESSVNELLVKVSGCWGMLNQILRYLRPRFVGKRPGAVPTNASSTAKQSSIAAA